MDNKMIHIYWGLGKGKTSALNGSAIRATGANMRVGIFRFLKGKETSEDPVLKKSGIFVLRIQSSPKFVMQMKPNEILQTRDETKQMMKYIKMNANKYDMIILDEFLDLMAKNVNFFTEIQLINFVESLGNKEILISGHTELKNLFIKADLITEFKPEKHYFEKGVKARKGIEY